MAITGIVWGTHEALDVGPTLAEIARNHHIALAQSEQDFHTRVRDHLNHSRPNHSPGFTDYLTNIAWSRHTSTAHRLRLEITPAALALLTQYTNALTDQPGAHDLRDAVTRAAHRTGWTTQPHTEPHIPQGDQP